MSLKTTKFDAADYLTDIQSIAAYLNDALQNGSPEELVTALGTVARAKGMSQIARDAGLGRESLYKALSGTTSPEFATVSKVIASLGLRVAVVPERPVKRRAAGKRAGRAAV
jgi:probable addiction module antidote protein